jgi:hypothetical protein
VRAAVPLLREAGQGAPHCHATGRASAASIVWRETAANSY